jgi:hypothetical protein
MSMGFVGWWTSCQSRRQRSYGTWCQWRWRDSTQSWRMSVAAVFDSSPKPISCSSRDYRNMSIDAAHDCVRDNLLCTEFSSRSGNRDSGLYPPVSGFSIELRLLARIAREVPRADHQVGGPTHPA